ncbi:MAG: ferrous iron transport protein A [Candidatus Marinimicrobia bacterium]|nr:ferrous iron transport protein A [Candidatus Neomarinimicrobiota bacterium]
MLLFCMNNDRSQKEPLLLSDADTATRYRVLQVTAEGVIRQRMLNMGLVPGVRLEVVRFAPLGDPIEIRIKRFFLSLRKEEAKRVLVEAVGPCPRRRNRRFKGRSHGKF